MNNRIRYTLEEIQRNIYYQMPKFLFEGELENLSNDARVLYSLLRDRHELSIKNQWINDNGEVYLIFSRENMCEMLKLSRPTITKAMNDLKKYNLIDEKRLGQGKANHIYLLLVDTPLTYERLPKTLENTEKEKIFPSDRKDEFSEGKNLSFLDEISFPSEKQEFFHQKGKNFSPINIGLKRDLEIHNNSNHIVSNLIVGKETEKEKTDTIRYDTTLSQSVETKKKQKNKEGFQNANANESNQALKKPSKLGYSVTDVEEIIKQNINYDYILLDAPHYKEMLDGVLHVIVSTIMTDFKDDSIGMGEERVPAELVKSVFFKLTKEDIEYFFENFNRQTDPTIKLTPYIRTSLYRNHGTNNFYWTNRVHVDIPNTAEKKLQSRTTE